MMAGDTTAAVKLDLDDDSALVLFELLARRSEAGGALQVDHPAEDVVLDALEAQLETQLAAPFAADYRSLLDAARARLVTG